MKKLPLLVTAGLLSAIIASASFAGPGRDCHRDGERGGYKDRAFKQLDLSDEQKTAIAEIRNAQREQYKANRDMRNSGEWLSATPDQADYDEQVQAFAKQRAAAVEAKILEKSRVKAEIYALLTPEQKSQLVEIRQEMQAKRAAKRAAREERRSKKGDSEQ